MPVVDPPGASAGSPRVSTPTPTRSLRSSTSRSVPAEATDDDEDGDGEGGRSRRRHGGGNEQEKSYALHAAAELVEKVAALQAALPESMLDDWLDHLDRMFRASFPEALIATWRSTGSTSSRTSGSRSCARRT